MIDRQIHHPPEAKEDLAVCLSFCHCVPMHAKTIRRPTPTHIIASIRPASPSSIHETPFHRSPFRSIPTSYHINVAEQYKKIIMSSDCHCCWRFFIVLVLACFGARQTVLGFAAAKKKRSGGKNAAAGFKGFGTKPPTYEEVIATFKTQQGPDAVNEPCPCGTTAGALYGDCCAPYHQGQKLAESPAVVLKTRYSAFYYRLIPYIISTTHPVCSDYNTDKIKWAKELHKNGMFDSFDFVALEPGVETPGKDANEGFLEFKVKLRARDGLKEETVISEKSRFLKQGEEWLYASGEVTSQVAGLEDIILNQ